MTAPATRHLRLAAGAGHFIARTIRAHSGMSAVAGRPLVVVLCADDEAAERAQADAAFFLHANADGDPLVSPLLLYPGELSLPWDAVPAEREVVHERLAVLHRLQLASKTPALRPRALFLSPAALIRRGLPRAELARHSQYVLPGVEHDREALVRALVAAGYERTGSVDAVGQLAVRGAIVDVWPPSYRDPVRIEFFGDEVESLRAFDPTTQLARSRDKTVQLDELYLAPAREVLFDGETVPRASAVLLQRADALSHPSRDTRALLDEVERGDAFFGVEALLPAFYGRLEALTDHLPPPEQCVWIVEDPERVEAELHRLWEHIVERSSHAHQQRVRGRITFEPDDYFVGSDVALAPAVAAERIELHRSVAPVGTEDAGYTGTSELRAELKARTGRDDLLEPLVERVRRWTRDGRSVVITCGDDARADRMARMLADHRLETRRLRRVPDLLDPKSVSALHTAGIHVHVAIGSLSSGLVAPDTPLVVVSEADIFGPRAAGSHRASAAEDDDGKPKPRSDTPFRTRITDLRPGDFVVHVDYGIGRYAGMKRISAGGKEMDFLELTYRDGQKVHLPPSRVGALQRYTAPGGGEPRLDKIGGDAWARTKAKVRSAVLELAGDLLNLYAARELRPGRAFGPPDVHYREFEAAFEFDETPDQLRAVEEVLSDLQKPRPMDRLVCGDVGFGKTEVAMRAAFKAVEEGLQVAVLVPTTVLAQQHYRVFTERFSRWPITIDVLSRFRTPAEQKETLARAAEGKVDVVIGTHRLLQRDVRFKELGLVVVDEEHRFGVRDKERLKKFVESVHCLTLSATPIPRTLHMGMLGLRDLSLIATPPRDRHAIKTTVCKFDPDVVRDAIRTELHRGGQVFFVHNRIGSIAAMKEFLGRIVPDARVVVGHGQMGGEALEKIMVDFVERRADVLLSTAIVESGIDIPAANTIIVNRADSFGLAQLYQLRGRVGRGRERAQAYLLVPQRSLLTKDAHQRLEALARFTELGSGFQVASQDLEIRGAGDLLGEKQAGQIAAVGFDLYVDLLADAVRELRGAGPEVRRPDPEMKVAANAMVPEDWIPDVGERLAVYRALGGAGSRAEVLAVAAAAEDRYGQPPPEFARLVAVNELKVLARALGATFFEATTTRAVTTLAPDTPIDPKKLQQLVNAEKGGWQLRGGSEVIARPSWGFGAQPLEDEDAVLVFARAALERLATCAARA